MDLIVGNAEIQSTKAFQKLEPCFQNLVLKLASKKIISNGLSVYRNSGQILGSVGGNNLKILKELIENEKN